jgi:acetyl-CoA acetyltransferase
MADLGGGHRSARSTIASASRRSSHFETRFLRKEEAGSSKKGNPPRRKIPVNTSGPVSKGHVIGATGISQIIELVRRFGAAGRRQVEAPVALQHNGGGFIHTDTASCFIHILRK